MKFFSVKYLDDQVDTYPCVLLRLNTWNDFGYRTLFSVYLAVDQRDHKLLGNVKILQKGAITTSPPASFESLDGQFASLGQGIDYYKNILALGLEAATTILHALRDIAIDPSIVSEIRDDEAYVKSLLRDEDARKISTQTRELLEKATAAAGTPFIDGAGGLAFKFTCNLGFVADHVVEFSFPDHPAPLGRMMAIVGKNGTGKTRLLAKLAQVLSGFDAQEGMIEPENCRARVVAFSFSAFDQFTRPAENDRSYRYYGLRTPPPFGLVGVVSRSARLDIDHAFDRLAGTFDNFQSQQDNKERFRQFLYSTGAFASEPALKEAFDAPSAKPFVEALRKASSGHQMLVFVAAGLVESVREGTVVFFDEPETHFHPNLLSTLLRLLYDILKDRGAFAIVATHSPIVLQEIPRQSIRIIRMAEGRRPYVQDYLLESFGENLSEIVRYAFDVEQRDRSYLSILKQLAEKMSQDEVEALFDQGLGLGAMAYLESICRDRKEKP